MSAADPPGDAPLLIDGLQYANWSRAIFEQMRRGGVSAVHVTIAYWEGCRETLSNVGHWNRRFAEHSDLIVPAHSAADLRRAREAGKTAIIYGFQNCSPIEDDIDLVEVFHALGVRFMQLSYNNQSPLATGCYEQNDPGITRFGKQVIAEMNRVGMVIDMSHSAERSTLEAIELSRRPIAISHANPASWAPALRNKSDRVLTALARSGGILGLSLYPFHLKDHSACTLEAFCEMVARTVDSMGIEQVAIGSDLCQDQPDSVVEWMRNGRWSRATDFGEGSGANPGWPKPVPWFGSNLDFRGIAGALAGLGFAPPEVARIMGANWLRFFEQGFTPE